MIEPTNDSLVALDRAVIVSTSVTELIPETGNGTRSLIIITNGTSTGQIVRLGVGKDADSNSGIILFPGGVYMEAIDQNFTPTSHRITAIVDSGTTSVYVHMRLLAPRIK